MATTLEIAMYTTDAWDSGFRIKPIVVDKHPTNDAFPSECNGLFLYRNVKTDYSRIAETTLFSVNGLVDKGTSINEGIILSNSYSNEHEKNNVTLIRFDRLGKLAFTPINNDSLVQIGDTPLRKAFAVKTNESLIGKYLMVVLNGFLHIGDNVVRAIGDRAAIVDTLNIPIANRYLTTYKLYDYGLPEDIIKYPFVINQKAFYSNKRLHSLFTAGNSFIITMDNPNVVENVIDAPTTGLPGRYLTGDEVSGLFQFYTGEVADYKITGYSNGLILACEPKLRWHKRNHTTDYVNNEWATFENDPPYNLNYSYIKNKTLQQPT